MLLSGGTNFEFQRYFLELPSNYLCFDEINKGVNVKYLITISIFQLCRFNMIFYLIWEQQIYL